MRAIRCQLPCFLAAVLLAASPGCRSGGDARSDAKGEASPQAPPGAPPAGVPKELPTEPVVDPARYKEPLNPECQRLYMRIQGLDAGVPWIFRDLKRSLNEINEDVKLGVELARRFLAECPDTPPTCSVKATLARFLMVRNARYREELEYERRKELVDLGLSQPQIAEAWPDVAAGINKLMEGYFDEVESLAFSVLGECSKGSEGRPSNARLTAMRAIMDLRVKEWDYAGIRQAGSQILKEYPSPEAISSIHSSVAEAFLNEEKYEEAADYLRKVIAERSEEPEYVIYNNHLFEALTGMGDLEGMEELAELMRAEYPQRMIAVGSDFLKNQYEQWHYNALFWAGFARFAQGDAAGALKTFEQSATEVDALEAQLAAQGKALNKVIQIFRAMRTADMIQYLTTEHGKVPPVDFDLSRKVAARVEVSGAPPLADRTPADPAGAELWATQEKVTLEESRGKVVAVLFRRPGDMRSSEFLKDIDQLVKERAKDGLVGLTLGFLTGRGGPADDANALDAMRKDLRELGVSLPAGYDPDRERQNIFRTLHATVGTASFMVFNRKGEHAWYHADPRTMDFAIARRVIDRILAE